MRNWFIVYPRGKELSLVARTFLDFAVAHGPLLRERLQAMWPALRRIEWDAKMPIRGKKRSIQ
mgnify:CR=1 FL=1